MFFLGGGGGGDGVIGVTPMGGIGLSIIKLLGTAGMYTFQCESYFSRSSAYLQCGTAH